MSIQLQIQIITVNRFKYTLYTALYYKTCIKHIIRITINDLFEFFFWKIVFFRGDQIPSSSGTRQNVFRCVRWEKSTAYSYSYYILAGLWILTPGTRDIYVNDYKKNIWTVTSWVTNEYNYFKWIYVHTVISILFYFSD